MNHRPWVAWSKVGRIVLMLAACALAAGMVTIASADSGHGGHGNQHQTDVTPTATPTPPSIILACVQLEDHGQIGKNGSDVKIIPANATCKKNDLEIQLPGLGLFQSAINGLQSQITALGSSLTTLQGQVSTQGNAIATTQATVVALQTSAANDQSEDTAQGTAVATLQGQATAVANALATTTANDQAQATTIAAQQTAIAAEQTAIAGDQAAIATQTANIVALQTQVANSGSGSGSAAVSTPTPGTLFGMGDNYWGELGNGLTTGPGSGYPTPVAITGMTNIVQTAEEGVSSVFLKGDGTVWAVGMDQDGELGNGTTTRNITTPVQVSGLTNVVAVAAEYSDGIALKSDGTVWAWGLNNNHGQLGNGSALTNNGCLCETTPVQVKGLTNVIAISGEQYGGLALKSDGTVWAWGRADLGQVGDGTTYNGYTNNCGCAPTPVQVQGLTNVTQIAAQTNTGMALKSDGTVWGWGWDQWGQLAIEPTGNYNQYAPVQIAGLTGVVQIQGFSTSGLALKSDGTVWSWGENAHGELGNGTVRSSDTNCNSECVPAVGQVSGLSNITSISASPMSGFAFATASDGTIWGWGQNQNGELGTGSYGGNPPNDYNNNCGCYFTPVHAGIGLPNPVRLYAGTGFSFAIKPN